MELGGAEYDEVWSRFHERFGFRASVEPVDWPAIREPAPSLTFKHPGYRFSPAKRALMWEAEWKVPVYPDGDYYAFLTEDLTEGTFGHPWERSI